MVNARHPQPQLLESQADLHSQGLWTLPADAPAELQGPASHGQQGSYCIETKIMAETKAHGLSSGGRGGGVRDPEVALGALPGTGQPCQDPDPTPGRLTHWAEQTQGCLNVLISLKIGSGVGIHFRAQANLTSEKIKCLKPMKLYYTANSLQKPHRSPDHVFIHSTAYPGQGTSCWFLFDPYDLVWWHTHHFSP